MVVVKMTTTQTVAVLLLQLPQVDILLTCGNCNEKTENETFHFQQNRYG